MLTVLFGRLSLADGVCGDGAIDSPEQCDDGNLKNGDGCTSICMVEQCGNGTLDTKEQCDDGSTTDGDGCSHSCLIEFCGDGGVDAGRGETCDDGNGVSGDGCDASCRTEGSDVHAKQKELDLVIEAPLPEVLHQSAGEQTVVVTSDASQTAVAAESIAPTPTTPLQATQAKKFLASPESDELRSHLTAEQDSQLGQILSALSSGEPLTPQERVWAGELRDAIAEAQAAERERYTNLLRAFITPISAQVMDEKHLDASRLVDVALPLAVTELQQAVEVIQRGELKQQVLSDSAKLKRLGIDIESAVPRDTLEKLDSHHSIAVFEAIKDLKEAAEEHATTNLPASLGSIQSEAETLRQALPILEREYGLRHDEADKLLADITSIATQTNAQSTDRLVNSVHRFLGFLERKNVLTSADLASGAETLHPAADVTRIAAEAGDDPPTVDIRSFVDGMAAKAPDAYKAAFVSGTLAEQRSALLQLLTENDRVSALLEELNNAGRTEIDARFAALKKDIANAGEGTDTDSLCDDSIQRALECTTQFLKDLEEAGRSKNALSQIIGSLQDYFGIGQ